MLTQIQFDRFMRKYGTPLAILVGLLIIAASIYLTFGRGTASLSLKAPVANQPVPPAPTRVSVAADISPVLGDANAPVTMIEFSDFQCPFCRRFWVDSFPQLKKNYIDIGKVKLVYRNFPLPFHPGAEGAAEAALCARDQGKFWEMHDKIFSEQAKQGNGTISFSSKDVQKWAADLGLDMQQFDSCMTSRRHQADVQNDARAGTAAGVTGTPTFFINGVPVVGAQPYAIFAQTLDQVLQNPDSQP